MSIERWVAGSGVGLTWTGCFSTEINSIVSGNAILSSITISNATALDLLCDVSISLGSVTTGSGLPYVGLYFYPLNQDGSTYGDNRFGSSASGPPPTAYYAGAIPAPASTTASVVGMIRSVWLPPGSGRFVLYNNLGVTLASSTNTVSYRTYNLQVV